MSEPMSAEESDRQQRLNLMAEFDELDRRRARWNLLVRVPGSIGAGILMGAGLFRVAVADDFVTLTLFLFAMALFMVGQLGAPLTPRKPAAKGATEPEAEAVE